MQETQDAGVKFEQRSTSRDFPSKADILIDVRNLVETAAATTSLTKEPIEDLLTAVDEAAANAIRHGSPKSGPLSIIRITCLVNEKMLEIQVRDFGRGFSVPDTPVMPSPDAMGGRGLPLMVALADSVAIASTPQGTTVTLTKNYQ